MDHTLVEVPEVLVIVASVGGVIAACRISPTRSIRDVSHGRSELRLVSSSLGLRCGRLTYECCARSGSCWPGRLSFGCLPAPHLSVPCWSS